MTGRPALEAMALSQRMQSRVQEFPTPRMRTVSCWAKEGVTASAITPVSIIFRYLFIALLDVSTSLDMTGKSRLICQTRAFSDYASTVACSAAFLSIFFPKMVSAITAIAASPETLTAGPYPSRAR